MKNGFEERVQIVRKNDGVVGRRTLRVDETMMMIHRYVEKVADSTSFVSLRFAGILLHF